LERFKIPHEVIEGLKGCFKVFHNFSYARKKSLLFLKGKLVARNLFLPEKQREPKNKKRENYND
jgi:hypothetical protein